MKRLALAILLLTGCEGRPEREDRLEYMGLPQNPHYIGDTVNYFFDWGGLIVGNVQKRAYLYYPGYVCIGQAKIVNGQDDGGESKIMVTLVWSNQYPKVLE